ncbi:MAG: metallophosphoesterase family protein [Planctomycetaceae bacterium]|nr:metallophosphatase family protein [Planctomycetaceae bacterium]
MKILLIADIHANYHALRAVLDAFADVDETWFLGDVISYGWQPSQCLELVRRRCSKIIRGNHDLQCYGGSITAGEQAYLAALPAQMEIALNGTRYLLTHDVPGQKAYFTAATAQAVFDTLLASIEQDVVLCGHSHTAMLVESGGKTLVNVGTVGQPRDGDPRAQCMLMQDGRFSFHRVAYDLDAMEADYRRLAPPGDEIESWIRWARQGMVDVHGLQRGPFSE